MELGNVNMLQVAMVTFFMACFNKLWDPVAAYVGHPFNLEWRVNDFLDAAERVRQVQADLVRLNPFPYSARCKGWLHRVHMLLASARAIKAGKDLCGRLNFLGQCKIGKEADRQLKKAIQLDAEGKDLLHEAQARPRPVRTILVQHPQYDLCGVKPYKDKVPEFLECNVERRAM